MPRFKLELEYNGSGLVGWQRQREGLSIQGLLEKAIHGFCGKQIVVTGAGRTDAGVHALRQVAHFDLPFEANVKTLRDALNDHLRRINNGERRISILSSELVPSEFNARFSAVERTYIYRIINRSAPLTLEHGRAWQVYHPLNVSLMHQAAQTLIGKHDFTAFRSINCQASSAIKTLDYLAVERIGTSVSIEARARSFLHNQVRAITGTLVNVGCGKISATDVFDILESRDRSRCGRTAPAEGLYLADVKYNDSI